MGIVRLKAGHSNSTLRLLTVRGIHSISQSNRPQHCRVSVTLLIALWNPNSPSAELLWIHPAFHSQETCERLTKEPGLNAIGSGNGWLFRWDKPNQRKRKQMVFSPLSIVRFYWLGIPAKTSLPHCWAFCHREPLLPQWPTVLLDGLGFSLDFGREVKPRPRTPHATRQAKWDTLVFAISVIV